MLFVDNTINEYGEKLSSAESNPGGGSVAALSGLMAVCLVEMVANLSQDKPEKIKKLVEACKPYREYFTDMIDLDGKSFRRVLDAFKLGKESEEERELRKKAVEEGYKYALEVPLDSAKKAVDFMKLIEESVLISTKLMLADAKAALIQIKASISGALLNVEGNLKYIKDDRYKTDIKEQVDHILNMEEKLTYSIENYMKERF